MEGWIPTCRRLTKLIVVIQIFAPTDLWVGSLPFQHVGHIPNTIGTKTSGKDSFHHVGEELKFMMVM